MVFMTRLSHQVEFVHVRLIIAIILILADDLIIDIEGIVLVFLGLKFEHATSLLSGMNDPSVEALGN